MIIGNWLDQTTGSLQRVGIATARLDTLVLLEDIMGRDRAELLAHPELELTQEQLAALDTCIRRRQGHEPLAYIRGHSEFYGRTFIVTPDVLVPRPETEAMVEAVRLLDLPASTVAIDVGTGSGAIGISVALEYCYPTILIDNDARCLEVASRNATKHQVAVTCLQADLLQPLLDTEYASLVATPLATSPDCLLLLCNLPYVPANYPINRATGHEPATALFSGADGLDHYRQLFAQLDKLGRRSEGGYAVLTESLPEQHAAMEVLAKSSGGLLIAPDILPPDSFIQAFRFR